MNTQSFKTFLDGLSSSARETLETKLKLAQDKPVFLPSSAEEWLELQTFIETQTRPACEAAIDAYRVDLKTQTYGDLTALNIKPPDDQCPSQPVLFLHGGAYTGYSAHSTLSATIPLAAGLKRSVVSIDYPLAPHSTCQQTVRLTAHALSLACQDHPGAVLIGDSAGGGLALAATSRLIHQGLATPSALILISAWTDLSNQGDSKTTLKDHDPIFQDQNALPNSAHAYAPDHLLDPEASPVYADYDDRFPPTLVICGTRDILLSDSVRLYQKMKKDGAQAVLDLYEGLHHSFPTITPESPEAAMAHRSISEFIRSST